MKRSLRAASALLALAAMLAAAIAAIPDPTTIETDARRDEPPLPLTPGEEEKFAAARAAVAAAEAAGTRWLEPVEGPAVTFGPDAAAAKLARLRGQTPDESPERPGIAASGAGGSP